MKKSYWLTLILIICCLFILTACNPIQTPTFNEYNNNNLNNSNNSNNDNGENNSQESVSAIQGDIVRVYGNTIFTANESKLYSLSLGTDSVENVTEMDFSNDGIIVNLLINQKILFVLLQKTIEETINNRKCIVEQYTTLYAYNLTDDESKTELTLFKKYKFNGVSFCIQSYLNKLYVVNYSNDLNNFYYIDDIECINKKNEILYAYYDNNTIWYAGIFCIDFNNFNEPDTMTIKGKIDEFECFDKGILMAFRSQEEKSSIITFMEYGALKLDNYFYKPEYRILNGFSMTMINDTIFAVLDGCEKNPLLYSLDLNCNVINFYYNMANGDIDNVSFIKNKCFISVIENDVKHNYEFDLTNSSDIKLIKDLGETGYGDFLIDIDDNRILGLNENINLYNNLDFSLINSVSGTPYSEIINFYYNCLPTMTLDRNNKTLYYFGWGIDGINMNLFYNNSDQDEEKNKDDNKPIYFYFIAINYANENLKPYIVMKKEIIENDDNKDDLNYFLLLNLIDSIISDHSSFIRTVPIGDMVYVIEGNFIIAYKISNSEYNFAYCYDFVLRKNVDIFTSINNEEAK